MSDFFPIPADGGDIFTPTELAQLRLMRDQLQAKRARNRVRQNYYDQRVGLKDLGISIPPQLRNIDSVLGWPAKTVDVLADRIRFEKFISTHESNIDPFGLNELVAQNDFQEVFAQAASSALINSCAFITVTQGDTEAGEPEVLWLPRSAHWATGLWDQRKRSLTAGLSVTRTDTDEFGDVTVREVTVYLPDKTVVLGFPAAGERAEATAVVLPNPVGRPLMVALVVGADLRRPFGRSRITRAVMSLTDSAVRTIVRSEVAAEFFSTPQRAILGADPEALEASKWDAVMSKMLAISRDENGELPQIQQFSQMSMQPHTEQLRQWAALLAAESSIPLDELGFPSDNPSSDSAIQSQRDPLRLAAERCIRGFQSALRQVAVLTVALQHGWETAQEVTNVQAHFAPTVHVSDAAAADAVLKQVQVMPWLAESGVVLEKLGYSAATAERLMSDKRRAEGVQALGFYKQYKERKDAEQAQRQEKLAKQPLGEFEIKE